MPKTIQRIWNRVRRASLRTFLLDRPLVLLQSDDWGRVGVRDHEGASLLRTYGIELGDQPYDSYTLETAEDVVALRDLLKCHRDSIGRPPSLVMNFVLANLDFTRMIAEGFREIHLRPLTEGLPGRWNRPGLFEAYRAGIDEGVFYPALHGLTHFCRQAVEDAMAETPTRRMLLHSLWAAETPYIFWRMPWVGYEYRQPEKSQAFLTPEEQFGYIQRAFEIFTAFFNRPALSACAPGYRANAGTHYAWSACGIRVAQNGSGIKYPPYLDSWNLLNLQRTIDFEPSTRELPLDTCMLQAEESFERGVPAIISVHAINFHSTLRNFRDVSLRALDRFLSALERKYPDLLYIHDGDMYELVTRGRYQSDGGTVALAVKQRTAAFSSGAAWSLS